MGWFLEDFKQVLLVDNHAPLGYHVHDNLEDPKERKKIDVNDPYEALEFFVQRAKEISDET